MTIKEAEKIIAELKKENEELKAELAKYDGKKPAGRRVHDEKWMANYDLWLSLFEKGDSIVEIMNKTGFSKRTCYRYKEYYNNLIEGNTINESHGKLC